MRLPFKAILVMAAAGLADVLSAPVQAATSPGAHDQMAQPVSSVRYDEDGLDVTVLKYAAGVAPSSVVSGPCSISPAIGFGVVQLVAAAVARGRGLDPGRPRNLARSVILACG